VLVTFAEVFFIPHAPAWLLLGGLQLYNKEVRENVCGGEASLLFNSNVHEGAGSFPTIQPLLLKIRAFQILSRSFITCASLCYMLGCDDGRKGTTCRL
jgi:hypothetical protein